MANGDGDRAAVRLGVYLDGPYRSVATRDGVRIAPDPVDYPFLRFACAVGERIGTVVLFARVSPAEPGDDRPLLPAAVGLQALPDYGDLRQLGRVGRAAFGTLASFWRGLGRVDTLWVFGPHPFGLLLVVLARLRGKQVVLGVRQDTVEYFRSRLPHRRWAHALVLVQAIDASYRALARRLPATVVGAEIHRRYGGERAGLLQMTVSLVPAAEVVREPAPRSWAGVVRLLTVGRIDEEKNPLLLVEALAELERRRPGRYALTWVGTGPLSAAVARRARELGIASCLSLRGYVAFGPALLDLYRGAHAFVHVARTEGLPQVLLEALASGAPVVATDVGGVGAALEGGAAGLLVPPDDAGALADAIVRVTDDETLRESMVARGLELARRLTLESQSEAVARFLASPRGRAFEPGG